MVRQARSVVLLCAVLATAVAAVGAVRLTNPGLTVHEWGTLTSVGGPDGQAMYWQPLSGPQDLPCFVLQQNPSGVQIKGVDVFGPSRVSRREQKSRRRLHPSGACLRKFEWRRRSCTSTPRRK
jgi:hypothetical protein